MALTPNIRSSLGGGSVAANASTDLRTSAIGVFAATNIPTQFIKTSALGGFVSSSSGRDIRVTTLGASVLILGKPENRKARAWTASLDGHDFYILRLGEDSTLVYDKTTEQWSQWDSNNRTTWRAHQGFNWIGISKANYLGGAVTNIIAGDDTFGVLWTLNPSSGIDDAPTDVSDPQPFTRVVTAGVPMRGRDIGRTSSVFLNISNGNPELAYTEITLRTSDDLGATFVNQGTVNVTPLDYTQEVNWRSLGAINTPGRIFEFTDQGATVRIDDASINIRPDTDG